MPNDNAQNSSDNYEYVSQLPLAFPYVPMQRFQNRYSDEAAIVRGTMFPELDLPFKSYVINSALPQTPETMLKCLHFICVELRLYLDTHPDDSRAMEYYRQYSKKLMKLKDYLSELSERPGYNSWVFDPWPWEGQEA